MTIPGRRIPESQTLVMPVGEIFRGNLCRIIAGDNLQRKGQIGRGLGIVKKRKAWQVKLIRG